MVVNSESQGGIATGKCGGITCDAHQPLSRETDIDSLDGIAMDLDSKDHWLTTSVDARNRLLGRLSAAFMPSAVELHTRFLPLGGREPVDRYPSLLEA